MTVPNMPGLALALLAPTLVFACGGVTLPQAEVRDAQAEITAAEAIGAEDRPDAALHLKLARDNFEAAKQYADRGEEEQARRALAAAKADAEVAIALVEEAEAQAEARELLDELNAFHKVGGAR